MLACVQVLWLSLADLKLCLGDSGLEGLETFSGTVTELGMTQTMPESVRSETLRPQVKLYPSMT